MFDCSQKLVISVILSCCIPQNTALASEFSEALTTGTTDLGFRYRLEHVDQNGAEETALASTLRTRFTWQSGASSDWRAGIEVDNTSAIGAQQFNSTVNGHTAYPVVADPENTDLNQAWLALEKPQWQLKAGRQRINHGSQRFLGTVGWRQNEQTFDSLRFQSSAIGSVELEYDWIWRVHTIFGTDSELADRRSDIHAAKISWSPMDGHRVQGFFYGLKFDDYSLLSSNTAGIEYAGQIGQFSVEAVVAQQKDAGNNPVSYNSNYYWLQATYPYGGIRLIAGIEQLGSDSGMQAFKTPLATLHKFQGFADKFLATPDEGIKDLYLGLAGRVSSIPWALRVHDFHADYGEAHYGRETDLSFTLPVSDSLSLLSKFAYYDSDALYTGTFKFWLQLDYQL